MLYNYGYTHKMDTRTFDLNLLKVVQAISMYGTISKAAEKMNVTQPAISNALARLREITGDPIFIRGRQGQIPTQYGKSLIAVSRSVLTQVRSCMETAAEFDPTESMRLFRVAVDDFLEVQLLPYFLKAVSPYLRNIELQLVPIRSLDLASSMESDDIDLCISAWVDTDRTFKRVRFDELLSDPVCIAVANSSPYAKKRSLSRQDFLEMKYVIVRPEFTAYQAPELQLRNMGIHRDVAVQVSRATSLPAVAAAGGYAITVPQIIFGELIKLHNMKTFDMPFEFAPVKIVAGYHVRDEKSPAVAWLRRKFQEAAREVKANFMLHYGTKVK